MPDSLVSLVSQNLSLPRSAASYLHYWLDTRNKMVENRRCEPMPPRPASSCDNCPPMLVQWSLPQPATSWVWFSRADDEFPGKVGSTRAPCCSFPGTRVRVWPPLATFPKDLESGNNSGRYLRGTGLRQEDFVCSVVEHHKVRRPVTVLALKRKFN